MWNNIIIDDEYIADGENKTANQEGWLTGLALVQVLRSMYIRTLLWSLMVDCFNTIT